MEPSLNSQSPRDEDASSAMSMVAQETTMLKPSPLSIRPEEYVHTPSTSTTVSPAESLTSDVAKQLKPWERSASVVSSVNSSEISEPIWEDDVSDAGQQRHSIEAVNDEKESTQSLNIQAHLRGMQRRLDGLQRLMQEAAQQSRLRSYSQDSTADAHLVSVVEADAGESTDFQSRAAPSEEQAKEPVKMESVLPRSDCNEDTPNDEANDSRDDPQDSSSSSSDEDGPPAITTLLNRIKSLQAQLKEATDENQQLQNTVHRLEEENARLQAQTSFNPLTELSLACDQESICEKDDEAVHRHDESLTIAIFGEPSAFQLVMEEDLAILKNHERCQHKLHELWDTVRTLRTFVETYELERNAMKIQRDDAIADADRADAENVKLASSSNQQQKIKYLQQVKKDNQALRRKNRALNVRIVQQAAKFIREKNGCSLYGEMRIDTTSSITEESVALDDTLLEDCDEPSIRTGEEILRSLRDHSGVLEERLERLRLARHELSEVEGGSSEEASRSEVRTDSAAIIGQRSPTKRVRQCCRGDGSDCKDLRIK